MWGVNNCNSVCESGDVEFVRDKVECKIECDNRWKDWDNNDNDFDSKGCFLIIVVVKCWGEVDDGLMLIVLCNYWDGYMFN